MLKNINVSYVVAHVTIGILHGKQASYVLVLGILFSFIMLLVDIVYAFVDPRIKARYEGSRKRRKINAA